MSIRSREDIIRVGRACAALHAVGFTGYIQDILLGAFKFACTGASDEFWGIDCPVNGPSTFRSTGESGVACTGYAREIRSILGRDIVEVYGFSRERYPESLLFQGTDIQGHDFALVCGRYIVDPWIMDDTLDMSSVPEGHPLRSRRRLITDLCGFDPLHTHPIYGYPSMWELVE